jgi:hypothetical protein
MHPAVDAEVRRPGTTEVLHVEGQGDNEAVVAAGSGQSTSEGGSGGSGGGRSGRGGSGGSGGGSSTMYYLPTIEEGTNGTQHHKELRCQQPLLINLHFCFSLTANVDASNASVDLPQPTPTPNAKCLMPMMPDVNANASPPTPLVRLILSMFCRVLS